MTQSPSQIKAGQNLPLSPFILEAIEFAALRHHGQVRDSDVPKPYLMHLLDVAGLLLQSRFGYDEKLIIGGIFHDILEDTNTSYAELSLRFGTAIAHLVDECTDAKGQDKATRRANQIKLLAHKSPYAKLVKLADKISNCRDMAYSGWSPDKQREYLEFSAKVADVAKGICPTLDAIWDKTYADTLARLDNPAANKPRKAPANKNNADPQPQ